MIQSHLNYRVTWASGQWSCLGWTWNHLCGKEMRGAIFFFFNPGSPRPYSRSIKLKLQAVEPRHQFSNTVSEFAVSSDWKPPTLKMLVWFPNLADRQCHTWNILASSIGAQNWIGCLPYHGTQPSLVQAKSFFLSVLFCYFSPSSLIPNTFPSTLFGTSPSSILTYIPVHFPCGTRIYIPENSNVCALHLYKWHCAIHFTGNAFYYSAWRFWATTVVNVFPFAALSYYVCRYQHSVFLSERYLGCLQSLPSKTTLPWASSHLSPSDLGRVSLDEEPKSGAARSEGICSRNFSQLVIQMLHQLALPQPCLKGPPFPHPCRLLILSDFLMFAKQMGKKQNAFWYL